MWLFSFTDSKHYGTGQIKIRESFITAFLKRTVHASGQISLRFICPTHPKSFMLRTWTPPQVMWLREAAGQDQTLDSKRRVYVNMYIARQYWSSLGRDLACSGLDCGGVRLFSARTVLLKVMKSKCSKSVWQLKDCSVPSKSPMALNRTQSRFADGRTVKCIHSKQAVVQMSTCKKEKQSLLLSHFHMQLAVPWPLGRRSVP